MTVLKKLRELDDAAWTPARDKLAGLLAEQAGAAGTPARDNARQMFLDFLNRVRGMTATDSPPSSAS